MLHVVTTDLGLSLAVFAVLRLITDRQTDGVAKGDTMHKAHWPKVES